MLLFRHYPSYWVLSLSTALLLLGCTPGSQALPPLPEAEAVVPGAQPDGLALSSVPLASASAPDKESVSPPETAEEGSETPSMPESPTGEDRTDDSDSAESSGPFAQGPLNASPVLEELLCSEGAPAPLPGPGEPGSQGFWNAFRTPLPPAPVWSPPGQKRVGLQAGHWLTNEVPPELGRLVTGAGTSGGGKAEWEVNLDIAQRTAKLLEQAGVAVDILPTTIPERYRAHVFLSIHADGDLSGSLRGFKIARAGFSAIPEVDDLLVEDLYVEYQAASNLPRDDIHISRRMVYYYAFNSRRYCHAVAPGVPAAIIETGFLTNPSDRSLLLGQPDRLAAGIANGILRFLQRAF